MILAAIIILLALVSTTYILETNSMGNMHSGDYEEGAYLLDLLEDEGLLSQLSTSTDQNDSQEMNKTIEKIEYFLSATCKHEYTLSDESINKTLINHSSSSYDNVYSFKKLVNNHYYMIKEYH